MKTSQGKELKAPEEKTVFEEDLSPEEKAKILKEKILDKNHDRADTFDIALQSFFSMGPSGDMVTSKNDDLHETVSSFLYKMESESFLKCSRCFFQFYLGRPAMWRIEIDIGVIIFFKN